MNVKTITISATSTISIFYTSISKLQKSFVLNFFSKHEVRSKCPWRSSIICTLKEPTCAVGARKRQWAWQHAHSACDIHWKSQWLSSLGWWPFTESTCNSLELNSLQAGIVRDVQIHSNRKLTKYHYVCPCGQQNLLVLFDQITADWQPHDDFADWWAVQWVQTIIIRNIGWDAKPNNCGGFACLDRAWGSSVTWLGETNRWKYNLEMEFHKSHPN